MTEFLIILALSIFFVCLALFGLAVKAIFKKDGQLTTCRGSQGECGCGTQTTCSVEGQ